MAVGQWDIKRVLAFSTISQLGFMVAAVGLGGYVAALFHLLTHAVFKALLFLGSGSVIHGVEHGHHHAHAHAHDTHGEEHGDSHAAHDEHTGDSHGHDPHAQPTFDPQDMRNMGGLFGRMPITAITYIIGTFALSGIPIFAGFWSKDEILGDAFNEWLHGHNQWDVAAGFIALVVLLAAAGLTAFYMWRQIEMVFFGTPRSEAAAQAPESVSWMTIPLMILAFFSITIGFINVPANTPIFSRFLGLIQDYEFKHFLESAIPSVTAAEPLDFNIGLAAVAVVLAVAAILFARSIYGHNKAIVNPAGELAERRDPLNTGASGPLWRLANARLYWDETYFRLFENPYNRISQFLYNMDWNALHDYFHDSVIFRGYNAVAGFLARPFDQGIIDGVVNGVARVVRLVSGRVRGVQTGYVRTYAVALLLGVVAVVIVMLLPLLQAR
jgi:NADH-quinone oxidoreductase subunit L